MNNKLIVFGIFSVLAIAFGIGVILYKDSQMQQQLKTISTGEAKLIRDHSPSLGTPLYRVSLVEFLDPECESCRRFHPIVKGLLKKYENRIHYVVRYAPYHRNSKESVAFLEAARIQGKYWETLDLLFERQPEWADHHQPKPELKWNYIADLGLDENKMRQDMTSADIQKIIELDTKDGMELQIRGTPTFFINGEMLRQFGAEHLEQAIIQAMQ